MSEQVPIGEVRFRPATRFFQQLGLMGYVSLRYGIFVVRGISVRRTRGGKYRLSFPAPPSGKRSSQDYIQPVNNTARDQIEGRVIPELRQKGKLPPAAE